MSSPTPIRPEMEVPVTTTPNPFMLKTRSTGRRNGPWASENSLPRTRVSSTCRTSSSPSPVVEETATMGASSRKLPARN